jgi:hypothetical protein
MIKTVAFTAQLRLKFYLPTGLTVPRSPSSPVGLPSANVQDQGPLLPRANTKE